MDKEKPMKASKKKIGVSVVSCLIMIGCGVNEDLEMQESVDEVAMSLESGLVVIGGSG
jgi:Tfp pilus assembly protein PilP